MMRLLDTCLMFILTEKIRMGELRMDKPFVTVDLGLDLDAETLHVRSISQT